MSRTNGVLLGLVVVLSLLAYRVAWRDPVAAERAFHPLVFDVESVTGLEIENEHGRIVLDRRESTWSLAAPFRFPADTLKVATLVDNLESIRTERPLPRGNTPAAELQQAGLDHDVARFVIRHGAGSLSGVVGRPPRLGSRTYLAVAGRNGVFTLVSSMAAMFFEPANAFRDPRALRVDAGALVELQYSWPDRRLVLQRAAPGYWITAEPNQGPVHPDALSRVFRDLAALRVRQWIGAKPEDPGPGRPAPAVSGNTRITALSVDEGARRSTTLWIQNTEGRDRVQAGSSPPTVRFELDREDVDRVFSIRAEDLRDTVVLRARPEAVRRIQVRTPERPVLDIERTEAGWTAVREGERTPLDGTDAAWIRALLGVLNRETIVRFFPVDDRSKPNGLEVPRLNVEIGFRGPRPKVSVHVGSEQGDSVHLRRDEESIGLAVSRMEWNPVLSRFVK